MPAIKDRSDENRRRKDRLAKQKKGPGWFRYTGGAFDVEHIPTVKRTAARGPLFSEEGEPVVDSAGRQIFKPAGSIITDDEGKPVLGGPPKVVKHPIDVFPMWGIDFPRGEPVWVDNTVLALKLRGMDSFEEVEPDEAGEPAEKEQTRAELMREAKARGLPVSRTSTVAELQAALGGSPPQG